MNQPSSNILEKTWLYCTVFLTGAAVMVIELLGTRLIAPFYGASLYVWTSIISVTLIALALGYYLGGIWADRARSGLSLIIALAGFLTLIIPWLTGPILLATDPLGLRLGSFIILHAAIKYVFCYTDLRLPYIFSLILCLIGRRLSNDDTP